MKKFFYTFLISITAFSFASCSKEDDPEPDPGHDDDEPPTELVTDDFFILNSGSINNQIDGTLSFYTYSSDGWLVNSTLTAFKDANYRSLGVNPTAMAINGNYLYVVVNGSETLEIIDLKTMRSVNTVAFEGEKYGEPRQIVISDNIAYITMFNGYIARFDCVRQETIDYASLMHFGTNPDGVAIVGRYIYVALNKGSVNMDGAVSKGKTVVRFEKDADWTSPSTLMETIEVGVTPTNLVTNGTEIFVVCAGDGIRERSQIWKINGINATPYCDGTLANIDTENLYVINAPVNSVLPFTYKRYSVIDNKVSTDMLASGQGVVAPTSFAVNPITGDIIICSAEVTNGVISETVNGYFEIYSKDGERILSGKTGINPFDILFLPRK